MTAKEKAKELVNKMSDKIISFENIKLRGYGYELAKQCALIAVDEILNNSVNIIDCAEDIISDENYWQQVKEEIEKL